MWDLSSLQLAKLQFFSSLSFFSAFGLCTVVLGWVLLVCKGMTHGRGADARWMDMYRFWVRIFALCMTVALPGMIFVLIQAGALWPNLFVRLGPVSGPLIVLIVALAFIIKLFVTDVMLYQQGALSAWLHTIVVFLAALGLTLIAIVLICFQSWLHFPAGLVPDTVPLTLADWHVLVTQSYAWHRVAFMLGLGCLGTGGLMVSICAGEALSKPLNAAEQTGFTVGSGLTALGVLVLVGCGTVFESELFRQAGTMPISGVWTQKLVMGLLVLIGLALLGQWGWYAKRRSELGKLPRWMLHVQVWVGPLSWLILWLVLMLLSLRDGQYFVHGLITYAEAFTAEPGMVVLALVTLLMIGFFVLIAAGFVFLVRRAVRFGVVPVRKIRRTA